MIMDLLREAGVECFTREQWGSPRQKDGSYQRRRSTHPMPTGPALYHFLHITVTADTDTVLEGAAGARQVESYGLSTPPMVSYHDLVTNEGRYYEGQSYGVKGTHTVNDKSVPGYPNDLNLLGYATAIMQNVGDEVTDAQVRVIAMCAAAREIKGLVRRGSPIYPHRMFDWKACPGDKAVARLDEIVRLKNNYVKNGLKEDDMPAFGDWPKADKDALASRVADEVLGRKVKVLNAQKEQVEVSVRQVLARLANSAVVIKDEVAGTENALGDIIAALDEMNGGR